MHTGMTDDKLGAKLKDVDALWGLARLLIYSPTIEADECPAVLGAHCSTG